MSDKRSIAGLSASLVLRESESAMGNRMLMSLEMVRTNGNTRQFLIFKRKQLAMMI